MEPLEASTHWRTASSHRWHSSERRGATAQSLDAGKLSQTHTHTHTQTQTDTESHTHSTELASSLETSGGTAQTEGVAQHRAGWVAMAASAGDPLALAEWLLPLAAAAASLGSPHEASHTK
jgi:carbohydrate-binding DOMON domain-containing protein